MSITIAWIGEGDEPDGLIHAAVRALGREFAIAARRVRLTERPTATLDPARRQHSSRAMLGWLDARMAGGKVLGVTDVDLFIPVLTFVFGEAQLGGHAAIVSIARLGDPKQPERITGRLAKEAVHEVGHTYGLVHCASGSCVMARSPGLAAVDVKTDRLCADCRVRYRELREPPYVAADPTHPDR